MPASRRDFDHIGHRNQECGCAFGRVKQAEIHRGKSRTEGVGAGRGEETENLTPSEEDKRSEEHEGPRSRAKRSQ